MLDKLKNLGVPGEHLSNTESANEALNKMKDFITGMNEKKEPEKKESVPRAMPAPEVNAKAQNEKDSYYIRRELNRYDNLVGYESAIDYMRKHGVTSKENSERMQLVEQ